MQRHLIARSAFIAELLDDDRVWRAFEEWLAEAGLLAAARLHHRGELNRQQTRAILTAIDPAVVTVGVLLLQHELRLPATWEWAVRDVFAFFLWLIFAAPPDADAIAMAWQVEGRRRAHRIVLPMEPAPTAEQRVRLGVRRRRMAKGDGAHIRRNVRWLYARDFATTTPRVSIRRLARSYSPAGDHRRTVREGIADARKLLSRRHVATVEFFDAGLLNEQRARRRRTVTV